jgi:hypothetical protein
MSLTPRPRQWRSRSRPWMRARAWSSGLSLLEHVGMRARAWSSGLSLLEHVALRTQLIKPKLARRSEAARAVIRTQASCS